MNKLITILYVTILAISASYAGTELFKHLESFDPNLIKISTCFTPGQNCTQQIVKNILAAKKSVYVQAYSFTSKPIVNALITDSKRGVQVIVILDKSQLTARKSVINDIPYLIDSKVRIAHNKVIIIDGKEVVTGSFNFTDSAQKYNAENVVFIHDEATAYRYTENFLNRKSVSK